MANTAILFPLFALMGLTTLVGLVMLVCRIRAVQAQQVKPSYFKLLKGDTVPPFLEKLSNNFNNLFALPMHFYALLLVIYVTQQTDTLYLGLAWGFVATRALHSFIHITYNHVIHRMLVFVLGWILLIAILIRLVVQLSAS